MAAGGPSASDKKRDSPGDSAIDTPKACLLGLPAELRISIYRKLPELIYGHVETVGPRSRLTPAISRVNQLLRRETLPLYAKTARFAIQTDDDDRLQVWLQALGEHGLANVESLQLSKHWRLTQPTRWEGHIGFYVQLSLLEKVWTCVVGTYPIVKDQRRRRMESADLLRAVIMRELLPRSIRPDRKALSASNIDFIVEAMQIVARHPIPAIDHGQDSIGAEQPSGKVWHSMCCRLKALEASDVGAKD